MAKFSFASDSIDSDDFRKIRKYRDNKKKAFKMNRSIARSVKESFRWDCINQDA